ncbi:MAG: bifunctional riboflavin kinase/FAD synthetase [Bacillota bacterium]
MDVRTEFHGLKTEYPRIMLGLGNFDGVHRGHQELISNVVKRARANGCTPAIFTFNPHPLAVLRPEAAPPLLLSPKARERLIERLGVELLLAVPFTLDFARLLPEEFAARVLVRELGVKAVFVGYNYTFGYKGKGTPETLKKLGALHGFEVYIIPPVSIDGRVVSSTLIREELFAGRIEEARKLLGYHPFVEGVVVQGDRRGRSLGFPTANLELTESLLTPPNGVYAVKVQLDGETYLGVANVGLRPTFKGNNNDYRNIEVHLFDFQGDLYGVPIRVLFQRRLRDEKKFASVQDLIRQIEDDIRAARAVNVD